MNIRYIYSGEVLVIYLYCSPPIAISIILDYEKTHNLLLCTSTYWLFLKYIVVYKYNNIGIKLRSERGKNFE